MEYKKGLWSDEELDILNKYYMEGYDRLVKEGLQRSEVGVRQKMRHLGLIVKKEVHGAWTEEEMKLLVENYQKYRMSGALNCGINKKDSAIRTKVRMLGLAGNENEGVLWNDERINILLKYYPTEGALGVRKRGVRESKDIIIGKAIELGLGVKFG